MEAAHLKELGEVRAQLEAASAKAVEDFMKSAECHNMIIDASVDQFSAGFDRAVRRGKKADLDMTQVASLYDDPNATDSELEEEEGEQASLSDQRPSTPQPDGGPSEEGGVPKQSGA